MFDRSFDDLRNEMVDAQLIQRGIQDKRVLSAFRKVPRHRFVPDNLWGLAYDDHPLPIGYGQTISQPYMVALMTELLKLKGNEKVLEIGTGSGYQTAILAGLSAQVYSIDRVDELAKSAEKLVTDLGYTNIKVKSGDGTLGWQEYSPYDGIIVTAGAPSVPVPLLEQLSDGGRLIIPVGSGFSQMLKSITKKDGRTEETDECPCVFVPLIGKYGWSQDNVT